MYALAGPTVPNRLRKSLGLCTSIVILPSSGCPILAQQGWERSLLPLPCSLHFVISTAARSAEQRNLRSNQLWVPHPCAARVGMRVASLFPTPCSLLFVLSTAQRGAEKSAVQPTLGAPSLRSNDGSLTTPYSLCPAFCHFNRSAQRGAEKSAVQPALGAPSLAQQRWEPHYSLLPTPSTLLSALCHFDRNAQRGAEKSAVQPALGAPSLRSKGGSLTTPYSLCPAPCTLSFRPQRAARSGEICGSLLERTCLSSGFP